MTGKRLCKLTCTALTCPKSLGNETAPFILFEAHNGKAHHLCAASHNDGTFGKSGQAKSSADSGTADWKCQCNSHNPMNPTITAQPVENYKQRIQKQEDITDIYNRVKSIKFCQGRQRESMCHGKERM